VTAPAEVPLRPFVPAEVVSFLGHLGVGIHKLRAYPPGHPMRLAAVEAAFQALQGLLAEESPWRLGVGQTQFVVGEGVSDPDHFIIRDLAARLHRRQVGSLVFHGGLSLGEFTAALEALAVESPRHALGHLAEALPVSPTPKLEFAPMALGALGLLDGGVDLEVDRLWEELARITAIGGEGEGGGGGSAAGRGLGGGGRASIDPDLALLAERLAGPEARSALAAALERLGRMAQCLEGQARLDAEAKIEALLATVPREALAKVLEINLRHAEGRAKLLPASEWLPAVALIEVIESAARDEGQKFSAVFLRLMRKMAGQSTPGAPVRSASGRDLRLLVRALVQDWTLADPNSKAHGHILDVLARHDLAGPAHGAPTSEGLRLAQIALETDATGDLVVESVEQVIASGAVTDLVQILADITGPNRAAEAIWALLVAPANLRRVLDRGDLRPDAIREILGRVGVDGVALLLDRLPAIATLETQREVIEHVLSLGSQGQHAVWERVRGATPEQRRHYLHVLSQLPDLPESFSVRDYLDAPEPLVRLEALQLMVRRPAERDDALYHGLADEDERVVRLALEVGRTEMPRQCLSRLIQLLNSPRRSPELKARAIPALAQFDTPSIRQLLLAGLVVRRGWFRRRRIAPASPVVIAKLAALAARWADHPEVAKALDLARTSSDAEVAAAAGGGAR